MAENSKMGRMETLIVPRRRVLKEGSPLPAVLEQIKNDQETGDQYNFPMIGESPIPGVLEQGKDPGSATKDNLPVTGESKRVQLGKSPAARDKLSVTSDSKPDEKFQTTDPNSPWYKNLSREGSCAELLRMLTEEPEMRLRHKGKGGVTVLHKAVHHSHVELVKYVVEDMFDDKGRSLDFGNKLTLEDLLFEKDDLGVTAVTLAAMTAHPTVVDIFAKAIGACDDYRKKEEYELEGYSDHLYPYGPNNEEGSDPLNIASFEEYAAQLSSSAAANSEEDTNLRSKADITSDLRIEINSIVKGILESREDDFHEVEYLKDAFKRHADYNSVRMEEFFFHFLCGQACKIEYRGRFGVRKPAQKPANASGRKIAFTRDQLVQGFASFMALEVASKFAKKIVDKILNKKDIAPCLMYELFSHVDPQGRTPLHAAGLAAYELQKEKYKPHSRILVKVLDLIPKDSEYARCVNVVDVAGRTIVHQACMLKNFSTWRTILEDGRMNLNARVGIWENNTNSVGESVHKLLSWRSPQYQNKSQSEEMWLEEIPKLEQDNFYPTALHLLILHGRERSIEQLLAVKDGLVDVNARLWRGSLKTSLTPLQLAASLGHSNIVEKLLKHKEVKDNGKFHGPRDEFDRYSVIHVAAAYKRLKVLQTIIKNQEIYDPMITKTSAEQESPLHLVALTRKLPDPIMLQDILLEDKDSIQRCFHKYKDLENESLQKNYDANDIVCINIMLQVGFDIWSGDKDGREPYPGVNATIEAYKWWYARVAEEVSSYKQKMSGAMTAISVIAALVATAAFIGPLQPPLGYDSLNGYVQSSYVLVKIYFICNGLSFYFAVAAILAAVTPAIPMLRESTRDEIRRSQRSNKIAICLLLISIICILVSFSCSNIEVMRPFYGYDRKMMFYVTGLGGAICAVILVLFIMRIISQILDQPDLFNRFVYLPIKYLFYSQA